MMNKYKVLLEYDGTAYSGWQTQKNARSIQGTLIEAARSLLGDPVDIQGAGRTDAGVHALGQVAHLETPRKMPTTRILEGLNELLPSTINVLEVERVSPSFHARHHAVMRSYIYVISKTRSAFGKRYVWWVKDELDVTLMRAACNVFRGFHNFRSFADKRMDRGISPMVMLHVVDIREEGNLLILRVVGSHFLWKMVRRMVGVIVEVGRKKLTLQEVEEMLTHLSDIPAQYTAPPSGLYLEKVYYKDTLEENMKKEKPFFLRLF